MPARFCATAGRPTPLYLRSIHYYGADIDVLFFRDETKTMPALNATRTARTRGALRAAAMRRRNAMAAQWYAQRHPFAPPPRRFIRHDSAQRPQRTTPTIIIHYYFYDGTRGGAPRARHTPPRTPRRYSRRQRHVARVRTAPAPHTPHTDGARRFRDVQSAQARMRHAREREIRAAARRDEGCCAVWDERGAYDASRVRARWLFLMPAMN